MDETLPIPDLIPAVPAQMRPAPDTLTSQDRARASSMPRYELPVHLAEPVLARPRRTASLSALPGDVLAPGLSRDAAPSSEQPPEELQEATDAPLPAATSLATPDEATEDGPLAGVESEVGGLVTVVREEAGKRIVEVETDQKQVDDGYRCAHS